MIIVLTITKTEAIKKEREKKNTKKNRNMLQNTISFSYNNLRKIEIKKRQKE